ncbi:hypothetical protein Forpe1208_v003624 [Fusarium oxysporum f. sp. rapae]|uniref:Uncharacterized protein n=1 Tax=Fusarium oxysporum f. sp. rapae TaxID=485398 RepID=A0A8J5P6H0_FUSOX|nr:hypothetical protein Forpe1208_v003624 [Fusarium oxysporum f. sp. rapae]
MEVAEVESDKGGGGLTIGGIIGAVLGSIVIISIATYPSPKVLNQALEVTDFNIYVDGVDPVQSSDKNAASRGTSLPSTHTVRSIEPDVTFQLSRR